MFWNEVLLVLDKLWSLLYFLEISKGECKFFYLLAIGRGSNKRNGLIVRVRGVNFDH